MIQLTQLTHTKEAQRTQLLPVPEHHPHHFHQLSPPLPVKTHWQKAKVNYLKVQDQVRLAKRGIALKAKKLKTEVLSANADIRNYRKQWRFAKKVYENYSTRYKEGMVSISDVLIKQSKELEVLLKLLTAKNKRNTKIFELESLLNKEGRGSIFNVEKLPLKSETNTTIAKRN